MQPEISSFRLHLAAEGKAAKTIRTYTEAVQWFAAAQLLQHASRETWAEVDSGDVQQWMVRLLARYSRAYASNQYRGLRQFFKWLAFEEELPEPTTGLRPPVLAQKLVPVFTIAEPLAACGDFRCGVRGWLPGAWRGWRLIRGRERRRRRRGSGRRT